MRRRLWTVLSIGAVVLSAIGVQPASASWMVAPPPNRPKDFAFIKKDGVYHLFYIRHNTTLPSAQTEIDFGHATSYDLYNWTQQPPVLPIRPTSWDSQHVWAPSIVESCGVYTLFYCGVSNQPGVYNSFQRIGIATSTDLFDWSRLDQPVFACDQVPWVICDPLNPDLTGFRDAFVMPDPALPGGWLMLYTTVSAIDYGNSQIGMASSNGSLSSWTDAGALGISSRTITNSSTAESPHMFEHEGLWFLFFTINGTRPLVFATTPDPRADVSQWTWHGALDDMLGVGTNSWYASEYLRDGTHDYFCFVNTDRVEVNLMHWSAPDQFTLGPPDLFHVVNLTWSCDSLVDGRPARLRLDTVNGIGGEVNIEAMVRDSTGQWDVVPPDSVGLPASIPIVADTTNWTWTAQRWPSGSLGPMQLRIRTVDQTAITRVPILVVPPPPSLPGPGPTGPDASEDRVRLHVVRFAGAPGRLRVGVDLAAASSVQLDLFDVQGRRVATLARGTLARGTHEFEWDGRGRDGRAAGAGIYLVRLATPTETRVVRAALLP